jgi:heme exporter protein C
MSDNVLAPGRPSAAGNWLHRFANPGRFLRLVTPLLPSLAVISVALTALGMVWGFGFSPADWQQGDSVKIMYVHVPAAWVSMAGYASLAICSFFSLVWRHPLADLAAEEIGPVGAGFTGVCLVSGALWGKPEWGAYWVWDARLTSVLILFFLYLGHIALIRAFDNRAHGYRAAAILALVGAINLPIIVFSVQWWNTLHQGNSISLTGSKIAPSMLHPLLVATVGFYLLFLTLVCARMCAAIMEKRTAALLYAAAERGA